MIGFLQLTLQDGGGSPHGPITINVERIETVQPEVDGSIINLTGSSELYVCERYDEVMQMLNDLLDNR